MRIGRSGKRCCPKAGKESAKPAPSPKSPRLRGKAKCTEDFCATRPTYTKAELGEIAAGMAQAMPAALLQAVC
jgi:5,10-methenyltetrahydromethanopterin hydrogenase